MKKKKKTGLIKTLQKSSKIMKGLEVSSLWRQIQVFVFSSSTVENMLN